MDYVAQSLCLDAAGRVQSLLPIEPDCRRRRPQRVGDMAVYRKHDWPNRLDEPATRQGYQASDSVVARRGGRALFIQTFDFGTDGRTFGTFDGGRGDGGQVLLFVGDWASFAMTEDGGAGVQWFLGEDCRASSDPQARFLSWLVFRRDVEEGHWRNALARLNVAASPTECPHRFNAALTRFRQVAMVLPFRIVDGRSPVATPRVPLRVIVSEHFGGKDVPTADHLERFYLASGLGLVRWERWANANLRQAASVATAARELAATARCPHILDFAAPAPGWILADCRTWTTLVRPRLPWTVADYRWPALQGFGRAD